MFSKLFTTIIKRFVESIFDMEKKSGVGFLTTSNVSNWFSLRTCFFTFFVVFFYIGRPFMKAIDRKCVFIFFKKDAFLNWTGLGKTHFFFITETGKKNWKNVIFFHVLAPEKETLFFRKLIASGSVRGKCAFSKIIILVFLKMP